MARGLVRLEAHYGDPMVFGEDGEFNQSFPGRVRIQPVRVPLSATTTGLVLERKPSTVVLRIAQCAKVPVLNSRFRQGRRKSDLRESTLPRQRVQANIHDHLNTAEAQATNEGIDVKAFVADTEQGARSCGHGPS